MDLEPSPRPRFATSSPGGCPFFFILTPPPPLKMTGNQTLKFLWAPFEKFVCIKGQNFVGISEKKKSATPIKKPVILTGTGKRESRKELSEDY